MDISTSQPVLSNGLAMSSLKETQELRPQSDDTVDVRKEKLRKVAVEFEEIFARILLKGMRTSLTNSEMFGKGVAGEIYGDMMDDAIAERMASRSALGLADVMYIQLVKSIEAGNSSDVDTL